MARISNKASPDQIRRFLKSVNAARTVTVRLCAMLQDEEELVLELPLEDAKADAEWPQNVVDAIHDHAEGQGPGCWRYALQGLTAEQTKTTGTWCRINVAKSKGANGEDDEGLDGSVGAYVQQLQSALAESHKTNIALTKTVVDTLDSQSQHFKMLFDRQATLEKDRSELQSENLEHAAKAVIAAAEKATAKDGEDPFASMLTSIGPAIAEKLWDKHGPKLLKMLGIDVEAEMQKMLGAGETEPPKALPSGDGTPTPSQEPA